MSNNDDQTLNRSRSILAATNRSQNELNAEKGLTADPWHGLTSLTDARIAIGRAGVSTPTQAQLNFNLDHALARDAVNVPLNVNKLCEELRQLKLSFLSVHSQAFNRRTYLQRPDLGRRLHSDALRFLQQSALEANFAYDIAIVLVDGLSSTAVQLNGVALSAEIRQSCLDMGLQVAPLVIVEQGRVAIGDEIGEALNAKSVALTVGERPGLSSPDSLGIYYTFAPEVGLTDARRNCISNVRAAGLSNQQAVQRLMWLINGSRSLQTSGVALKDNSTVENSCLGGQDQLGNFLLSK